MSVDFIRGFTKPFSDAVPREYLPRDQNKIFLSAVMAVATSQGSSP